MNKKPTYQELLNQNKILRQKIKVLEQDEKFNNYFEHNKSVMLQVHSETKQILNANDSALKFYGYSKSELLKKTIDYLNILSPAEIDEQMKKAINNKSNFFLFKHRTANGKIKDVEVHASPFIDSSGTIMIVTVQDISKRIKTEKKLQKQLKEYAALNEEYKAANENLTISKIRIENNEIKYKKLFEKNPISLWEVDLSFVKEILDNQKKETNNLRKYLNNTPEFVIQCFNKLHVKHVNKVSLKLFNCPTKKGLLKKLRKTFNDKTSKTFINLLYAIAGNEKKYSEETEFVIDKSIVYVNIQYVVVGDFNDVIISLTDITGQKKTSEELRIEKEKAIISDLKHQKILNSFSDAIYINSPDYFIEYTNSSMNKITGGNKIGEKCYKAIYNFDNICEWCVFEKMREDEIYNYDSKYPINKRYYSINNLLLENGSKITSYHDITELKRQNEELHKLTVAVEQSPMSVIITDKDGNIEFTNPVFTEITGYSQNEVIGKKTRILKADKHTEAFYKKLVDTVKSGNVWRGEFLNKKKNGQLYWEEASIGPIFNEEGDITNYVSLKTDISEKKKIEEKLKNSEEHFRKLFEDSLIGMYLTDLEGNILKANRALYEMLGYDSFEDINKINLVANKTYVNNRDEFLKIMEGEGNVVGFESIWKKKNGDQIYVRESAKMLKNEQGKVLFEGTVENITEWKLADNELKEIYSFNERIIKVGELGFATYKSTGQCISANSSYAEILNLNLKEVLTQNFNNIDYWKKMGLVENAKECIKTGVQKRFIFTVESLHKEEISVEMNLSRYRKSGEIQLLVIIKNITEIIKSKKRNLQMRSEYLNLINNINIPIFGINKEGYINEWNSALEKISGYKQEEIKGEKIFKFFIDGKSESAIAIFEDALKGVEFSNIKFTLLTNYDTEINLLITTTVKRNIYKEIDGIIFVGQDITEIEEYKIELEQTVEERTRKLINALNKEKELNDMKSRFVSMASHEFRTPLSFISFTSGFMKKYWEKMDKDNRDNKFENIETQVKYMTSLLDDVLMFGKTESRRININLKKINIIRFLNSLTDEIRDITKNSHKINFLYDTDVCYINIDENIARNIFTNLLTNAVKFSPNNKNVDLFLTVSDTEISVKVKDQGIGINPEELEYVFSPFHRCKNAALIKGTGLGLAIVKESIDIVNGKIEVQSELNKGTEFIVTIPKNI